MQGINRNIVKTAHEPKPPKDYVDSSKDVIAAANKQKEEKIAKKPKIKNGPSISVSDADKLATDENNDDKNNKVNDNGGDDKKEEPESDDKNKLETDKETN